MDLSLFDYRRWEDGDPVREGKKDHPLSLFWSLIFNLVWRRIRRQLLRSEVNFVYSNFSTKNGTIFVSKLKIFGWNLPVHLFLFKLRSHLRRTSPPPPPTRVMNKDVVSIFHEVSDVRLRGLSFHRTRKQASDKWLECAKLRHGDFF